MTDLDTQAEPTPHAHQQPGRRRQRRSTRSSRDRTTGPSRPGMHMTFALPPRSTLIGVALVTASMVLGGGGTPNPDMEMALELVVAGLLLIAAFGTRQPDGLGRVPPIAWLIAAPLPLIQIAQLVPLPPAIWRNLPGREIESAVLDLVGAGQTWMPLSIAPPATLAALLATLCPVAIMLYVARLDLRGRSAVTIAIVVVALASMILGAMQLSHVEGTRWSLYAQYNVGWLVGFQANRNAQVDVLQIAMLAVSSASLMRFGKVEPSRIAPVLILAIVLILAVGAVMTGSRAGIALLPITCGFALAIQWPRLKRTIRHIWRWLAASVVTLALAGYGLAQVSAIQNVVGRFASDTDGRWDFWIDTVYAIRKSWPMGTGIGTFRIAFEAAERLELVNPLAVNRAHNDWLEFTLECGMIGWVAIAATALALGWAGRRSWRQARHAGINPIQRGQILFGTGVLMIESLHALFDYPTRCMSLATMIAVAVALLTPVAMRARPAGSPV